MTETFWDSTTASSQATLINQSKLRPYSVSNSNSSLNNTLPTSTSSFSTLLPPKPTVLFPGAGVEKERQEKLKYGDGKDCKYDNIPRVSIFVGYLTFVSVHNAVDKLYREQHATLGISIRQIIDKHVESFVQKTDLSLSSLISMSGDELNLTSDGHDECPVPFRFRSVNSTTSGPSSIPTGSGPQNFSRTPSSRNSVQHASIDLPLPIATNLAINYPLQSPYEYLIGDLSTSRHLEYFKDQGYESTTTPLRMLPELSQPYVIGDISAGKRFAFITEDRSKVTNFPPITSGSSSGSIEIDAEVTIGSNPTTSCGSVNRMKIASPPASLPPRSPSPQRKRHILMDKGRIRFTHTPSRDTYPPSGVQNRSQRQVRQVNLSDMDEDPVGCLGPMRSSVYHRPRHGSQPQYPVKKRRRSPSPKLNPRVVKTVEIWAQEAENVVDVGSRTREHPGGRRKESWFSRLPVPPEPAVRPPSPESEFSITSSRASSPRLNPENPPPENPPEEPRSDLEKDAPDSQSEMHQIQQVQRTLDALDVSDERESSSRGDSPIPGLSLVPYILDEEEEKEEEAEQQQEMLVEEKVTMVQRHLIPNENMDAMSDIFDGDLSDNSSTWSSTRESSRFGTPLPELSRPTPKPVLLPKTNSSSLPSPLTLPTTTPPKSFFPFPLTPPPSAVSAAGAVTTREPLQIVGTARTVFPMYMPEEYRNWMEEQESRRLLASPKNNALVSRLRRQSKLGTARAGSLGGRLNLSISGAMPGMSR